MDAEREQVRAWVESMDAQGYTSDEIRQQLALTGWSKEDIEALLGQPVAPPPAVAPTTAPPAVTPPVQQPRPVVAPPAGQASVTAPPIPGYAQAPAMAPGVPSAQPNGMATAALILGIASFFFGPLLAIVGLILGIVGMKRGGPQRGQAVGGLVISIVVLVGWLLVGVIFLIAAATAPKSSSDDYGPMNTYPHAPSPPESDEVKPGNLNEPLVKPEGEGTVAGGAEGDDKTVCLTRVKRLALGMKMYSADYDGPLPDALTWPLALRPYVKDDAFLCPADDRIAPQDPGGRPTSYTMYDPMGGLILSSLKEPAKAYLLFDGTEVAGEEAAAAFRHEGGLNLAYVDGHAQWVGEAKFNKPD